MDILFTHPGDSFFEGIVSGISEYTNPKKAEEGEGFWHGLAERVLAFSVSFFLIFAEFLSVMVASGKMLGNLVIGIVSFNGIKCKYAILRDGASIGVHFMRAFFFIPILFVSAVQPDCVWGELRSSMERTHAEGKKEEAGVKKEIYHKVLKHVKSIDVKLKDRVFDPITKMIDDLQEAKEEWKERFGEEDSKFLAHLDLLIKSGEYLQIKRSAHNPLIDEAFDDLMFWKDAYLQFYVEKPKKRDVYHTLIDRYEYYIQQEAAHIAYPPYKVHYKQMLHLLKPCIKSSLEDLKSSSFDKKENGDAQNAREARFKEAKEAREDRKKGKYDSTLAHAENLLGRCERNPDLGPYVSEWYEAYMAFFQAQNATLDVEQAIQKLSDFMRQKQMNTISQMHTLLTPPKPPVEQPKHPRRVSYYHPPVYMANQGRTSYR